MKVIMGASKEIVGRLSFTESVLVKEGNLYR